jgi:hypothetical protein
VSGHVLVLAERTDEGAARVAAAVAGRLGHGHVLCVRPAELGPARWSHRVDASGAARTRITLTDGTLLDSRRTGAVLNRLQHIPAVGFGAASAKDRDYARAELHALTASWLLSLGSRVVGGTAGAYGTAEGPISPMAALAVAVRCELPVARRLTSTRAGLTGPLPPGLRATPHLRWPGGRGAPVPVDIGPERPGPGGQDPADRILVAGDNVVGDGPVVPYAPRCRLLAERLNSRLLELRFLRTDTGPALAEVDLCPPLDLPAHRTAVADLLIALLELA